MEVKCYIWINLICSQVNAAQNGSLTDYTVIIYMVNAIHTSFSFKTRKTRNSVCEQTREAVTLELKCA